MKVISGEIEYGSIFFKDKAPLNFGEEEWDQGWEKVPFPVVTYTMFIGFVIAGTFLAFNVLVGLTVDDIRKFLDNADLRKVSMRLEFIRQMEQVEQIHWIMTKKKDPLNNTISKKTSFEAMIWKEIEKREMKSRKKGKMEEEMNKMQSKIKELKEMNIHTNKLVAEIKSSLQRSKLSG